MKFWRIIDYACHSSQCFRRWWNSSSNPHKQPFMSSGSTHASRVVRLGLVLELSTTPNWELPFHSALQSMLLNLKTFARVQGPPCTLAFGAFYWTINYTCMFNILDKVQFFTPQGNFSTLKKKKSLGANTCVLVIVLLKKYLPILPYTSTPTFLESLLEIWDELEY